MQKRNRSMYWIASIWLALGMTSTGIVQLIRNDEEIAVFEELGYPAYLMSILGVWKILGVVAILIPGFPLVKEWAYAGFFFVMSGAAVSHLAAGHGFAELFGPLLLILLTITSWYFRPESRKMPAGN